MGEQQKQAGDRERDHIRADWYQPQVVGTLETQGRDKKYVRRRKTVSHPARVGNENPNLTTCGMGIHPGVVNTSSVILVMHSAHCESLGLVKKGDGEGNTRNP